MTDVYATQTAGGARAGRERLVAALLAVAMLFCHGALGALHQASSSPVGHTGGHYAPASAPASAGHAEHHDNPVAHPLAHADYAAVLFVVLLGAALALLPGRFSARGLPVAPRAPGLVPPRLALLPTRGPTLPLLQVFRL